MKLRNLLSLLAASVALTFTAFAQSGHEHHSAPAKSDAGKLMKVSEVDAAWLAEARKSYPLEVCVMSGEKLGSMGDATEWVYRAKGQPDRLVKFCCDGCLDDFKADAPAAIAKLDAAAAKKSGKK
jgi:hypothetical protein